MRKSLLFPLAAMCVLIVGCQNGGLAGAQASVASTAGDVQAVAHDAAANATAAGDAAGAAKASNVEKIAAEVGVAASDPVGYLATMALSHKTGAYGAIGLALAAKYLPGLFGFLGLQAKPKPPATPSP